jgi:hypothetical protein
VDDSTVKWDLGKTPLVAQMIVSLALGGEFLGTGETKPHKVLMVDYGRQVRSLTRLMPDSLRTKPHFGGCGGCGFCCFFLPNIPMTC